MPYIGNPIYQSAFVTDQFSGDGTTTAFTMSVAPAGTTNVLVVVSGVVQDPSTYGVTGTTLNFSTAPPSGTGNISCRYLGVPVTGVTTTAYRTVTEFTATAGQTTFTPPSYNVGFINVYLNGVLLGSADYTATNGTTVVLATGASAGNLVTVESFRIESVANAISNSAGAVTSSNIQTSVTLTTPNLGTPSAINLTNATSLPASAMPSGSVVQMKVATASSGTNATTGTFVATSLTMSFTPKSASNTLLINVSFPMWFTGSPTNTYGCAAMYRNGSNLGSSTFGNALWWSGTGLGANSVYSNDTSVSFQVYDSPATTSAITYTLYIANQGSSGTFTVIDNFTSKLGVMTISEIAA
jgi:hypothetical protein